MMTPINIGPITIDAPVMLAPMSGISDLPFRRLVKRFGAGLVFSEMIASREALHEHNKSLRSSHDNYGEEFPIAVQLAGHDPEIMAEAAKLNEDRGASIIDINFGCPVKKIVKKLAGSALMQHEELACEIMEKTVKAVNIPVTVKMRLGWDHDNLNAPRLAKMAEDVGIKMVTVHGRTRQQMYNGTADWAAVKAVKDAINIPLIINGDILSHDDVATALKQSGADGVMIGRGACGKPWFLREIMDAAQSTPIKVPPQSTELTDIILQHFDDIITYYGERKGVPIARKHLGWYADGTHGAANFRAAINKEKHAGAVKSLISEHFSRS